MCELAAMQGTAWPIGNIWGFSVDMWTVRTWICTVNPVLVASVFSSFRTTSLPPLDWPLPSQFGQYELKIEVQPKAHHRAHYETEGSRGAVKAASGGHPIVKVSIFLSPPLFFFSFHWSVNHLI